ncbi:Short-chain alcohol dehydrogenase [[Clostridium] methylpentosum DSM 5476]|uniref:Trans-2-enoyl-CoA reductase [NADH] n=1 Tax=[Clostridium] methylpentosum DSM 5476 TaxID=537013 RepID=C0EHW6_9FIRM|nr:Short-chain alcohol dehydrogenase [[Clostridium] methylpentosum DSM 5476]MDY3989153.1 enoyl-ACP reductase FabV [Massilioclostridium sp.]
MVIQPKTRGFICTTAHPEGCRANVRRQVEYVKRQPKTQGAKRVLVLGASAGYGLASRISAAFSCDAATLGVIFDKPASGSRTASAGWYNTAAFEELAQAEGLYAKTINGDAFSKEIKEQVIQTIKSDLQTVDLVVYSLAAPRRTAPDGTTYSSVLKTTGEEYTNKTIDLKTKAVSEVTIPQASEQEIADTVKVMGGEDWLDWMEALQGAGVLAEGAETVAYSYIGPALTHPMYLNGSIGMAKRHLAKTAQEITQKFGGVKAYLSVNKALVTQSSAAIPIVPLYISILYKVMKEMGLHEGCIEQMYRLFHERLFADPVPVDQEGRIRLDDWEMRPEVQEKVSAIWKELSTENVEQLADIDGYWADFYEMFGFGLSGVDYEADVSADLPIPSIAH